MHHLSMKANIVARTTRPGFIGHFMHTDYIYREGFPRVYHHKSQFNKSHRKTEENTA